MEPTLDDASLVACSTPPVGERIAQLAGALKALDDLGAPRVLRAVRDAADRDIHGGRGLRTWCFDPSTPRDARLLVAHRLAKAPFLDGPEGLLRQREGEARAVHGTIEGRPTVGGAFVALADGVLVMFSEPSPPARPAMVQLEVLIEDNTSSTESVHVCAVESGAEVQGNATLIVAKIEASVATGAELSDRLGDLFPRLVLGATAKEQLIALGSGSPMLRHVIRHLRALDGAARAWRGGPYAPGVTWSVESPATLTHGDYGPQREFPTPDGFEPTRWTYHTKLTDGWRLYFKTSVHGERTTSIAEEARVAVGYVGPHLPTVRHPS
jgi:hypothetical protein